MPCKDLQLLNIDTKDWRYEKVWQAAMNPKDVQRLLRIENCELISIPSLCDEIAEKLNEVSSQLMATELDADTSKPMHSFLVASRLFIGLVYVHERQVKCLYDLVLHHTIPKRLLIENENIFPADLKENVDPLPMRLAPKKGLKRKRSTNLKSRSKRGFSLTIDTSDDHDDIEAQNSKTLELLQNSFVAKNADISIHEPEPIPVSEVNEFTYCFGMQFNEEIPVSERNDFALDVDSNGLLESEMTSMTLNEPQDIVEDVTVPFDIDMCESTRFNDTVYATGRESTEKSPTVPVEDVAELEVPIENGPHHTVDDSNEMDILAPLLISNSSIRKRNRTGRNQSLLIDANLSVNVKRNVKTVSTTQRHLHPRDDAVSAANCLRHLTRKIFVEPSHTMFSESMARQFESTPMSGKLLDAFKRMTRMRTEKTNRDMVQEFCTDLLRSNNQQSVLSMPIVEDSVATAPWYYDQTSELLLPAVELSVDGCNSQPIGENTLIPHTVDPPTCEMIDTAEEITIHEHAPIELHPSIRQLLINTETVQPFMPCDTDSQKQFASRSRRNKADWGREGVMQKLMSLWNSGVYPIGMQELMQPNNQRVSAATAFFSLMELNSARIGLIAITKCPDSNVIFNIAKSAKLIELQELL